MSTETDDVKYNAVKGEGEIELADKTETAGSATSHSSNTISSIVNTEELYPWAKCTLVALIIGIVEYAPATALAAALPGKLKVLDDVVHDYGLTAMLFTNIAFSVGLACFASLLVTLVAPSAGGSGIPQIIAYLSNGNMTDPNLLQPTTLLVKMVGVVSAITGGLIIGREGPAIHIGASIAYLAHDTLNHIQEYFTNVPTLFDGYVVHNIIMTGAASGFAAAFRAPVGGFMYCTEEIATHWDIKEHMNVGAQMFVSVAFCAFVTQTMMAITSDSGTISFSSVVIFEAEDSSLNAGDVWKYDDIPGFLFTAVLSGLIGGVVTKLSCKVSSYRRSINYARPWLMKTIDVMLMALITAIVLSLIPAIYPDCKHKPSADDDHRRLAAGGSTRRYCQYTCEDDYYSEIASLSLSGEENVIRHLMSRDSTEFGLPSLFIFLFFYIPLMIGVMGISVPAGTFVPNLLLGSLIGRICGEIWQKIYYQDQSAISLPGVYALVGAASMLGAWTRTMIAVVVTLIEISGDVGLVQPLVITCVISRAISTKIHHHSYAHEIFYDIMKAAGVEGANSLHPNDWLKANDDHPNRPKRKSSVTGVKRPSIEVKDPKKMIEEAKLSLSDEKANTAENAL